MNRASSDTTPSSPPADPTESAGGPAEDGEREFNWAAVVLLVHPQKVAIVEALHYIGRPMSASDFSKCFGAAGVGLSHISYHVRALAKAGVIRKVSERNVRGAKEKFYSLR